jgi:palmitoyltransferase ZDHHC1/11
MASRRHGLNLPLNLCQLLSWVLLLFSIIVSEMMLFPALSTPKEVIPKQIIFSLLYHVTLIMLIITGSLATIIDPTDPLTAKQGELKTASIRTAYCTLCAARVMITSKHCGTCNRCVNNFDHHCVWLNNCIGELNYKYFFVAVVSLVLNSATIVVFGVILFIKYFIHYSIIEDKVWADENMTVWLIFLIVVMVLSFIVLVFSGQLLFLNIWLIRKKITMFEYIMKKKKARITRVNPNVTCVAAEHESSSSIKVEY